MRQGTNYHTLAIPRERYEEELHGVLYLEGTRKTLSLAAVSAEEALAASFETVAQADDFETTGAYWDVYAPGVAIIGEPSEVEQLDVAISPQAESILRALDYQTYFALVAFAGKQTCYFTSDFGIEQALRGETGIELYAYVHPYGQQPDCPLRLTSPYHIITLPRQGLWRDGMLFTLLINDEHAVSGAYPPVVSQATPAPTSAPKVTP